MVSFPFKYRPEVDGLRAIAIVPVIFFHTGLPMFKSGLIGVDIFFIISGYLITSLIYKEASSESFSIKAFYLRRIRRLLPALFLMMVITIPISFFLMQPYYLENFGQSLVATLFMSNNFLLYITTDYWSPYAEFKPLLHTWSLAVEEQFYLIYPIFLLSIFSLHPAKIIKIYTAVILASIVFSLFLIKINSLEANFYLLPSRLWELFLGGVIAFLLHGKTSYYKIDNYISNNLASFFGATLILIAFIIEYDQTHPNYKLLIVALGTSLILLHCNQETILYRLLANKNIVFIGLISYSLYLWHNPIFAFLRFSSESSPTLLMYLFSLPIIFFISYLSWKIELRFRNRHKVPNKTLFFSLLVSFILILSFGLSAHIFKGFGERFEELKSSKNSKYMSTKEYLVSADMTLKNYSFIKKESFKIYVVGDSFSSDVINMVKENDSGKNIEIIKGDYNCVNPNQESLSTVSKLSHASDLMIISFHSLNLNQIDCYKILVNMLKNEEHSFLAIGSKDFGYNPGYFLLKREYRAKTAFSKAVNDFNEFQINLVGTENFLDFYNLSNKKDSYVPIFTPANKLVSEDGLHLTKAGAKYFGESFIDAIFRGAQGAY